jgi:hypothetical protein
MHLRLPHEGRTTPCRTARRLAQRQIRARLTEQLLETRPARLGNRKRGATLAGVKSPMNCRWVIFRRRAPPGSRRDFTHRCRNPALFTRVSFLATRKTISRCAEDRTRANPDRHRGAIMRAQGSLIAGWRRYGFVTVGRGHGMCRPSICSIWSVNWRRRPDLNRGWRFCRPLPYHLATAPVEDLGRHPGLAAPNSRSPPSLALRTKVGLPPCTRAPRPARKRMERETGFEPATSTLARSHSTTELFPLANETLV